MQPFRSRLNRLGLVALLASIAIELLWLLSVNVALNSGAMRAFANRKPETFRVAWARAWSLWPGDLRVRGLQVRGNHLNTQWAITAHKARAQIGLAALFDRRFLARGLVADRITIRHRRQPRTAFQLEKAALVPEIPWAEYALRPADEDPKAILAAEVRPPVRRLWALDLPGFTATRIREIWVDEFRYATTANTHGAGRLFVRPKERLDLEAWIELEPGDVSIGAEKALEIRSGRLDVSGAGLDLTVHRGGDVLTRLHGKLVLQSGVENIKIVDLYLGRIPGLVLRSGPGGLFVDLMVDADGRGSGAVDLRGQSVSAEMQGVRLRGDLRLDGRIRWWWLGGDGLVDLSGTRAEVSDVVLDEIGRRTEAAGWSGRAVLDEATLEIGETFRLKAKIAAELDDSTPLVAFFEMKDGYFPDALAEVLSVHDIKGIGEVRAGGGVADVRVLEIKGEDLELRARMRLYDERAKNVGIAYLKKGKLSVGLQKGGDRKVKITHPKKWFEEHPPLEP